MGHIVKCKYGSVPASLSDAKGCLAVNVQEYATAQDMMQSTCLKLGYAHTLGYSEVGDYENAYYRIDSANTDGALQCKNNLYAIKIYSDGDTSKIEQNIEQINRQLPNLQPSNRKKNIIVIGDSWTNGTQGGDNIVYRFTDYMQPAFGHVYNRGVGGAGFGQSRETTFLQIAQASKSAGEPADDIIVFGGCNDDIENVDAQVTELFQFLGENWPNAALYYAANINRNSLAANFEQIYSRYASATKAGASVIMGLPEILRNMDDYYTPEKWHMTTQAYKYIGACFIAALNGIQIPLPSYTNNETNAITGITVGSVTNWQKVRRGDTCTNFIEMTMTSPVAVGATVGIIDIERIPVIKNGQSCRALAIVGRGSQNLMGEAIISSTGELSFTIALEAGDAVQIRLWYNQNSTLYPLCIGNDLSTNYIDEL